MKVNLAVSLILFGISPVLFAGGPSWLNSIELAQQKAKRENKDIIVNFTGSDWCSWCIRLKREVWDTQTWQDKGLKQYVGVELDFPRRKKIPAKQKSYNNRLKQKYGIRGFPSILLLDANGRVYAQTGYQRGGPDAYIRHLKSLQEGKRALKIIDTTLKNSSGKTRTRHLKTVLNLFEKTNTLKHYKSLESEYLRLAKSHTPQEFSRYKNKKVLREFGNTYFRRKRYSAGLKTLKGLLADNPDTGQKQTILFYMGLCYHYQNKVNKRDQHLKKAIAVFPKSRIANHIRHVQKKLKGKR
jgi:thioredoxin-related protein